MAHNLVQNNKIKATGQVIRDSRFMTKPADKTNDDSAELIAMQDLEQSVAVAFDRKDVVQLASLLIEAERNNHFVKKAKNSPLYVYKKKTSIENETSLIQTAIYLLIDDKETSQNEITKAYNLLNNIKLLEKSPEKLKTSFENRLGIAESIKRKNSILNQLREARNGLGFASE